MKAEGKKPNSDSSMQSARECIKTVEGLAAISAQAKAEGKKVVLAHGVFDLLHMGHARHLETAGKFGDVLIATVTADAHVHKGPGQPVFPEILRAEMLAGIKSVDWTGINYDDSAEDLLRLIQPDVYVKGGDYVNPEDDVTGKIVVEREIVEAYGGRIEFTNEITFSSTAIINAHMALHDPETKSFIDDMRREKNCTENILDLIDRVANSRVLLLGETIIDEYLYVSSIGKPAKENIISTLYESRELFAGGVIAAANHVAGFCKEVEVVTFLGGDGKYEDLVRSSLLHNVKLTVFNVEGRPTIKKSRYVAAGEMSKLFEVNFLDDRPIPEQLSAKISSYVEKSAGQADLTIVCDFGHGLMVQPVIDAAERSAKFLAVNAQSNSANRGYNSVCKYSRADYVCIDEPEARLAVLNKRGDLHQILDDQLPKVIDCEKIIVTHGKQGCLMWDRNNGVQHVPAFTRNPVDTIGAGDAFLAITSPLVAAGGPMRDVGFVGNIAGGIKVGVVGHRQPVGKTAVLKSIISLLK